jgi:hypothetical protein
MEEKKEETRTVYMLQFRSIQLLIPTFISSFSFATTQDSTCVLIGYLHFPP